MLIYPIGIRYQVNCSGILNDKFEFLVQNKRSQYGAIKKYLSIYCCLVVANTYIDILFTKIHISALHCGTAFLWSYDWRLRLIFLKYLLKRFSFPRLLIYNL